MIKIEETVTDRNGNQIEILDKLRIYDWNDSGRVLGEGRLIFCTNEGRLDTEPRIVEDPYDFFSKALPNSEIIRG